MDDSLTEEPMNPPTDDDLWKCRLCDFELRDFREMLGHERACFIERKNIIKFEAMKRLQELNEGELFFTPLDSTFLYLNFRHFRFREGNRLS